MIKASTSQKKGFADPLHTSLDLPLNQGIDAGGVIDALDVVQIALANGITVAAACRYRRASVLSRTRHHKRSYGSPTGRWLQDAERRR